MSQSYPRRARQYSVVLWALCTKRMSTHPPGARAGVSESHCHTEGWTPLCFASSYGQHSIGSE